MSDEPKCSPFEGGVVRCFAHSLPAALKTSTTAANPNRKFYCCSRTVSDAGRCDFFYWQDELIPDLAQQHPQVSPSQSVVQTPIFPAPQTVKRNNPTLSTPSPESDALTSSQKRIKLIEAALKEQDAQDNVQSDRTSSKHLLHGFRPSTSSDMEQRHPLYSATTPHRSRNSANPATPLDIADTYVRDRKAIRDETTDEEWDLLTPPPTNPQKRKYDFRTESPTPLPKRNAAVAAYDLTTKLENSQEAPLQSNFGSSQSQGSVELSAESIAQMIQHLEGTPGYIRKLERRKIAAEKSNEAKARKISRLEKEIEDLRRNQQELYDTIALLKAGRSTA